MPNNVDFRAILGREHRPIGGPYKTQGLLVLTASSAMRKLPLNLVLLLDCSTSMTGPKLEGTKQAASQVIDSLDPDDFVSIVPFSTQAAPVFGPASGNKSAAKGQISMIQAQGVTNLHHGLDTAIDCLRRANSGEAVPLIVLLSDGMPTDHEGNQLTDYSPFHDKVRGFVASHGVSVATVGLGDAANYDASFLEQVSSAGKGMFYYAQDPATLASKFAEEIGKKSSAVANDLSFAFSSIDATVKRFCKVWPEYVVYDPPRIVGGQGATHCGPFLANDVQKYYVEFISTAGAVEERKLLSHVDVVYGGQVHASADLFVRDTRDERPFASPPDSEVSKAEDAAMLGKVMADLASSSDPKKTKNLAASAAKLTMNLGMGKATKKLEEVAASGILTPDTSATLMEDTKKTKRLA